MYYWNGSGNHWAKMTKSSDGDYYAEIPVKDVNYNSNGIIFCRMNSGKTALDWGSTWNQTNDLKLSGSNNKYTITSGAWSNGNGTWSTK